MLNLTTRIQEVEKEFDKFYVSQKGFERYFPERAEEIFKSWFERQIRQIAKEIAEEIKKQIDEESKKWTIGSGTRALHNLNQRLKTILEL